MTESASLPLEAPRRFHFDWVFPALFRPRRSFARISEQASDSWLTPMLILMIAAALRVAAAGPIRQAAAQTGQAALPPDFQYYSPEQQAQFMQAQAATSGPVFVYVFPAILAVLQVWVGWLLMAGLLHLGLTLLGGRGSTRAAMNLVAWAGLPFAVRDGVRAGFMLFARQLIQHPGLSGFAPSDAGGLSLFLAQLFGLIDLYLIWHILLLVLGVRASNGLPPGKAVSGVLMTMLVVLLLQALPGFALASLGGLTIIRPFF